VTTFSLIVYLVLANGATHHDRQALARDTVRVYAARSAKMVAKPKIARHLRCEAIRRRDRDGEPVREIARSYDVGESTISQFAV
jgi:hypothetical protein